MNDKCAAGTGRFFERVAAAVGVTLQEVGPLSLQVVESPVTLSSFCVIFAETDISMALSEGRHRNDILAGACESISRRIQSLLGKVGIEESFTVSGGVAKNVGVIKRLEGYYAGDNL